MLQVPQPGAQNQNPNGPFARASANENVPPPTTGDVQSLAVAATVVSDPPTESGTTSDDAVTGVSTAASDEGSAPHPARSTTEQIPDNALVATERSDRATGPP